MDFDDAINDHLELRRRNGRLERRLPLSRYRGELLNGKPFPGDAPVQPVPEETQAYAPGWLAAPEAQD